MAAIPYGSSYVEDKRSGLINQLILRCKNKKDYYITKFIVTFINGGTIEIGRAHV